MINDNTELILIHYPNGKLRYYIREDFEWEIGKKYRSNFIKSNIIVSEMLEDKSEVWFDWGE